MRILGIDLGEKHSGIAVSDESGCIAFPHSVIDSGKNLAANVSGILNETKAEQIVVGLPLNMDGTSGKKTAETEKFAEDLRRKTGIDVILWDERLTSVQTEKDLISAGMKRKKRKSIKDKIEAAVMLQSYLDSMRKTDL
jgi:putative Holliday junction resolvase